MVCKFPNCISWMLRKLVDMRVVVHDWRGFSEVSSPTSFYIGRAYQKLKGSHPMVT